jgi:hypothetical protein
MFGDKQRNYEGMQGNFAAKVFCFLFWMGSAQTHAIAISLLIANS